MSDTTCAKHSWAEFTADPLLDRCVVLYKIIARGIKDFLCLIQDTATQFLIGYSAVQTVK